MKIQFLGLINERFNYSIEINGQVFSYFAGIGHAYIGKKKLTDRDFPANMSDADLICKKAFYKKYSLNYNERVYIKAPTENDVYHCLFLDADCGSMSFNDFCSDFGYNNDSLKALDTYRACMENADKLKKALGNKYHEKRDEIQALEL